MDAKRMSMQRIETKSGPRILLKWYATQRGTGVVYAKKIVKLTVPQWEELKGTLTRAALAGYVRTPEVGTLGQPGQDTY